MGLEDEKQHPFSLVSINLDGRISSSPLEPGFFQAYDSFWKLDDLEGLALDRAGFVYAITSHSRDGDGDAKKSRDKLVRFRVEAVRVVDSRVSQGLKSALCGTHPVLAAAADILDVKAQGGLNIEALEISADARHLLIGMRSPLLEGRAIIARVENTVDMFEADAPPRISPDLITLHLGVHGIRGMAYLASLGCHLVISGPAARYSVQFPIWYWSGHPGDASPRVARPVLAGS